MSTIVDNSAEQGAIMQCTVLNMKQWKYFCVQTDLRSAFCNCSEFNDRFITTPDSGLTILQSVAVILELCMNEIFFFYLFLRDEITSHMWVIKISIYFSYEDLNLLLILVNSSWKKWRNSYWLQKMLKKSEIFIIGIFYRQLGTI